MIEWLDVTWEFVRFARSRKRALAANRAIVALIVLGACMPVPLHGPRVIDGWQGGTSLATTASAVPRAPGDVRPAFLPSPFDVRFAYGFTDDNPWHPALLLGAQATPLLLLSHPQTDVYVQVPRKLLLGLSGGAGVSTFLLAPSGTLFYSQLGFVSANHTGVYGMGGYLHQPGRDSVFRPAIVSATLPNDASVGTIATQIRLPSRGTNGLGGPGRVQQTLHLFVTRVFGHQQYVPCSAPCTRAQWKPSVTLIGAMLEGFHWRSDDDLSPTPLNTRRRAP